jgi:hypothetical protein
MRFHKNGWPHLTKLTEWGPAYTCQHSHLKAKARWVVRTRFGLRYEHILVWEKYHRRKLPRGWVVHHLDGNPLNNDVSNLEAMPHAAHNSLHRLGIMKSHVTTATGAEGKFCGSCKQVKPITDFPRNGISQAGTPVYRPTCRGCYARGQRPPAVGPYAVT